MNKHRHRVQQEAARWFARMRDAEPDHPERSRFEAWLLADPLHASEYAAFADTWEDFDSTARLQSLAQALQRKREEWRQQRASLGKRMAGGIMGLVLVVTSGLLGFELWRERQAQPLLTAAHDTAIGETARLTLGDDTRLTLNADTRIEVAYYRDRRTVTLKRGEAIFEVARDAARPFVVDSGHARVTVLGTRFAVNRLSHLVRVGVDHGRVRVEAQGAAGANASPLVLSDGQVAEVLAGGQPQHSQRHAGDAFSFADGYIRFERASLHEIAETLSRYRKSPVTASSAATEPHITAVVKLSRIDQFLKQLPLIAPVTVDDGGQSVRLAPR